MGRILEYIYIFLVAIALIPFGLVDVVPFSILAIAMFVFGNAVVLCLGEPQRARWVFRAILAALTLTLIWIVLQTLDLPFALLRNPTWADAHQLAGITNGSISIAPGDTLSAVVYIGLPAVTFLSGLVIANTDERAQSILKWLGIGAGLIAVFGIFQFVFFPDTLIAVEKRAYLDSLTAVFVNRNTAGTFLGLGFLILATLTWDVSRRYWGDRAAGRRARNGVEHLVLFAFLTLSCFTALMMTQSRGGVFATVIAALFLLPFLAGNWRSENAYGRIFRNASSTRRKQILRTIGAILVLVAAVSIFAGRAIIRARVSGSSDERFCVWSRVTDAISENWLTGTGFGTFRTAFSAYRDPNCGIDGIFDRAHNSYLEGFLGLGIPFLIVVAALTLIFVTVFVRGIRQRKRRRHYAVLGLCGMLLVALHATVDFSLQIPGFAVFFAAFLSAVTSICLGREGETKSKKSLEISVQVQHKLDAII